jgi:hypothetical protein
MFKMVEEVIKQMKRLQNPTIMDDDTIDMEDIEHQSENENMTISLLHLPSKRSKLVTTFHIFNIQLLI